MQMSSDYASWLQGRHKSLLRFLFLVLLGCVVASMVIPYSTLQDLVRSFAWLKGSANFFHSAAPGLDIHHLLSYAAVGFAAHIGWPKWRGWQVALGLYVLAGVVELVQVWVPGRASSILHVALDVVWGLSGFLIAWLVTYAWGNEKLPELAHSSAQ
jgi:hypothetical protein